LYAGGCDPLICCDDAGISDLAHGFRGRLLRALQEQNEWENHPLNVVDSRGPSQL
jgi:hypothetical protein